MEHGFKGLKTDKVFDHFWLSGSQLYFNQFETFYKQLSKKTMSKETQPGIYGEKLQWIWLNIMTNYNFCIVGQSGFRHGADVFVHLSFTIRTLLIEIMMEKTKSVVSGEHDFDHLEKSTLVAVFGIFALSGVQFETKNGGSLIENCF